MPRIRRGVSAVKIEYLCDRCERGVYRLVCKRPVSTDYVHRWQHRCTSCGDLADFTVPYPLIEIEGGPVSRLFVQREALPTPTGPVARGFEVDRGAD